MAKFPVELNDDEGIVDAVNNLLSGPSGLGQNFAGFSSYAPAWITGNFRKPYSQPTEADLYVPAISLSKAEMLDERTFKYTFTSTQASPPFSLGNGLSISGFTDVIYDTYPSSLSGRNTSLSQIGVVECTTDYVIVRSVDTATVHAPEFSTGSVFYYSTSIVDTDPFDDANYISTDCDVRVTVTGGTDRVFISGQFDSLLTYTSSFTGTFYYYVEIDRYIASPNNDPTNPDYIFSFDETVALKSYRFDVTPGTTTLPLIETVFATILDQPSPAYYRYILQLGLVSDATTITDFQIDTCEVGMRGLSSQVVKQ